MTNLRGRVLLGCGLAALLALQATALFRVAFNWDELAMLHGVAHSAREGHLQSAGHAGLAQVLLMPLVAGCRDEITVARAARVGWLFLTLAYAVGVFALLREFLRDTPRCTHDAALGTGLLVLLPVFLEWSVQVRTDQLALAGGAWGTAALLASRRRPSLAVAAGVALGVGWLSTQKLAYVGALAALLALGDVVVRREWRPRREIARGVAALASFGVVLFAFGVFVAVRFQVPEQHAALQPVPAAVARSYLSSFDFYRATLGYSQYRALLPTLGPHLALLGALVLAPALCRRARTGRVALAGAVLALGLAVGVFHGAAFAYFVMTLGLFPAAALAIALPDLRAALAQWQPRLVRPIGIALWAALALPVILHAAEVSIDTQAVQRESLRFVNRNFGPEQPGFQPEAALFCGPSQRSGVWFSQRIYRTFEGPHREREVEKLLHQFRAEPAHYLVQSFRLNQFPTPVRRFWAEHYQPYRGSVFVAGRQIAGKPGETIRFELLVDAAYRWLPLDGPRSVRIDGQSLEPGGVRLLAPGPHTASFETESAQGLLVLALAEAPGPAPLHFYKAY